MRALAISTLTAAALAAGCGGDGVKTFDEPKGTLSVKAGEEFRIVLAENPSTGYLWRFRQPPDPAVVRLTGRRFDLEDGGEERAGAGGDRIFTFRAVRRGSTTMYLENVFTGGERGRRPADTRRLRVDVGDG
jgi:predicted secreted protein